jgi:hypothetical protein
MALAQISTVRALHDGVVTFDGLASGYTVPAHLEATFREAWATRREVSFTTTHSDILTAELLPPRPSLLARLWAAVRCRKQNRRSVEN